MNQIDLKELQFFSSIPRNILLANVFYKAGFIESWGSGTLKIIDYCKKSSVKEVLFNDENNFFSITFILNVTENVTENRLVTITSLMRKNKNISIIQSFIQSFIHSFTQSTTISVN